MPSSAWRSTLFPYTTLFRSDRKSTRLNSSHDQISYAVFCLKKKAERAVADIRTSSISPLHGLLARAPLPIRASGKLQVDGVAEVGPATSAPLLYKRRLLPTNVPTMCWRLLVSREPPSQVAPPQNATRQVLKIG